MLLLQIFLKRSCACPASAGWSGGRWWTSSSTRRLWRCTTNGGLTTLCQTSRSAGGRPSPGGPPGQTWYGCGVLLLLLLLLLFLLPVLLLLLLLLLLPFFTIAFHVVAVSWVDAAAAVAIITPMSAACVRGATIFATTTYTCCFCRNCYCSCCSWFCLQLWFFSDPILQRPTPLSPFPSSSPRTPTNPPPRCQRWRPLEYSYTSLEGRGNSRDEFHKKML